MKINRIQVRTTKRCNDVFTKKAYIGLYGSVAIEKEYCERCKGYAFIIDAKLACCNKKRGDVSNKYKREIEGEKRRRRPSMNARRKGIFSIHSFNRRFYNNHKKEVEN